MSNSHNIPLLSIRKLLDRLWGHINLRRRKQFGALLILMVISSFFEMMSIGAALPFLGVITSPDKVFETPSLQWLYKAFDVTSSSELIAPITIIFCFVALISGATRLLFLWSSTRLSFAAGADLGIEIYRRTLYQPYQVHVSRNSSEVVDGISNKANSVIFSIIIPSLTIINAVIMLIAILVVMLAVDPFIAFVAFCSFSLIYVFINRIARNRLNLNSHKIARETTLVIKSLQEGLGGIRDVLIDGSQDIYCQIYRQADQSLRRAQGGNLFISLSPRYGIETLGMILIAIFAFYLTQQDSGVSKAIPILGALALGAQRLLPTLQQAYGSWSIIQGGQASLKDVLNLLDQPTPNFGNLLAADKVQFTHELKLKNIVFSYDPNTPVILNGINLTIAKGDRIGFIGSTGTGKSTILDIIMGLLQPTKGSLEVDNKTITPENLRSWQLHIAHVPQFIFLADGSIEENISLGVPKDRIDFNRIRYAAIQAQLAESIESWPDKYQTLVGERGVRLSGGQRQRIGIARALYKQADLIIFDEATSSLDNETEGAVMKSIENLSKDLTIIIVAHRLTTLKNCNKIIELDEGVIVRSGTYQDIVNHTASLL